MKIKEYIAKTTKEHFERIYIQGAQLLQTKFKNIGDAFSYKIDFAKKTVIILPEVTKNITGKGKISKKKTNDTLIPVLDIANKKILKAFEGCKECKVTIREDEILVEGLFDSLDEAETQEIVNLLKEQNIISLDERRKSLTINKSDLGFYMKQTSDGYKCPVTLSDVGYSFQNQTTNTIGSSYFTSQKVEKDEPFVISLLSLFSGIGAFEQALKKAGVQYNLVNYCEFDNEVAKAYSLINNEPLEKNLGDITTVDETQLADFELMTYGFPCQDITSLSSQKGLKNEDGSLTRSGLFYEAMRIAKHKKPSYMIAENVRNLVSSKFKGDFEGMLQLIQDMGYNSYYKLLNSKDYGVPQSRTRVFIVSIRKDMDDKEFEFPASRPLTVKANDLKETGCTDDSLYLGPAQEHYYNDFRLSKKYSSLDSDVLVCMTTKQGQKSNPQNFFTDIKGVRMLTAREMFLFQGFKKSNGDLLLRNGFPLSKIGAMLGNSITIQPLVAIFKNLFKKYLPKPKILPLYNMFAFE